MKIYIEDKETKEKIYLNVKANTRSELAKQLGSKRFKAKNKMYYVNQVRAERGSDNTSAGMILGGVLGLFGGPVGMAVGGALGTILGKEQDQKELKEVEEFNRSVLK